MQREIGDAARPGRREARGRLRSGILTAGTTNDASSSCCRSQGAPWHIEPHTTELVPWSCLFQST